MGNQCWIMKTKLFSLMLKKIIIKKNQQIKHLHKIIIHNYTMQLNVLKSAKDPGWNSMLLVNVTYFFINKNL